MLVTLRMLRNAGVPPVAARKFCAKHSLDWTALITSGVEIGPEEMAKIPLGFRDRILSHAEDDEKHGACQ